MGKYDEIKLSFKSTTNIEIVDPSREACIIYLDKNSNETHRQYFGNNPRIIVKDNG